MRHHRRLFPMLLLSLILSIIHLPPGVVSSSSLSFDVQFTPWGYDPQEVGFHQITSPNNLSSFHEEPLPYTAHKKRHVLPRKKRKNFVPDKCDCSMIDGVMYKRPAPLRDEATDEVASFKMTLCLRIASDDHRESISSHGGGGGRIGMFLFLVPYPWNSNEEQIEVGLDSQCTEAAKVDSIGNNNDALACAHVHYDSTKELLITNVIIGDHSCVCGRKLERSRMPKEAAVGFASTTAGDPIKLQKIVTWSFHSKLKSKDTPLMKQPEDHEVVAADDDDESSSTHSSGQQRLRVDPWNRNAELNLQYQRNWQSNWQLTCSLSISVGYGNVNGDTD